MLWVANRQQPTIVNEFVEEAGIKAAAPQKSDSDNLGIDSKEVKELREEELRRRRITEVMNELESLIGLGSVKKLVKEISAFTEIQKLRAREKLLTQPTVLHMCFSGHPGTGKTTVARILGRLLREMGVLSRGHIVEIERADLVGEYIGHTAHRTREQIKRALGGVLFIDEAYSLARGGEKDFGKEAIDAIVKAMEDHKDDLVLILAGYKHEMEEFLKTNPGLRSRFPIHIDFPNYTVDELVQIAELMLNQRQYRLDIRARTKLMAMISQKQLEDECPGNARTVRNLIERAMRQQAVRLIQNGSVNRDDLLTIRVEDLKWL